MTATRLEELKGLLAQLREGQDVVLGYVENQHGEQISSAFLGFRDGEWELVKLNCFSSKWNGMGICNCISHSIYESDAITRRQALAELRLLIEKERRGTTSKRAEIAWLEQAITSAP